MDIRVAEELLHELGSSLEELETRQGALLQFLKNEGIVSDDKLAPYLKQAGDASSVRWRAIRLRLDHIFSMAVKREQQTAKQNAEQFEPRITQQSSRLRMGNRSAAPRPDATKGQPRAAGQKTTLPMRSGSSKTNLEGSEKAKPTDAKRRREAA